MKILVLPDVQAKPGIDFAYLTRIGRYMVEKRPDHLVCLGDFADMPSLSSYDKGKKAFEGRRYRADAIASKTALTALLAPLKAHNEMQERNKKARYLPKMTMLLGNHEDRIRKAVEDDPKLDGMLSTADLGYEESGFDVVPFLEVRVIEGIAFSHYFTTGLMGRPASTAAAQLRKTGMSCFAGHQQGKQIAYATRADGATITSIISGSCYEHSESYLGPQGNRHWRGFWILHDVKDGAFDEMPVSISYINKKYPDVEPKRLDYADVL